MIIRVVKKHFEDNLKEGTVIFKNGYCHLIVGHKKPVSQWLSEGNRSAVHPRCGLSQQHGWDGALCYLGTVPTNDPENYIFWWRAKPNLPPFRCVADVYYMLAERGMPAVEKELLSRGEATMEKNSYRQISKKGGVLVETCGAESTVSA